MKLNSLTRAIFVSCFFNFWTQNLYALSNLVNPCEMKSSAVCVFSGHLQYFHNYISWFVVLVATICVFHFRRSHGSCKFLSHSRGTGSFPAPLCGLIRRQTANREFVARYSREDRILVLAQGSNVLKCEQHKKPDCSNMRGIVEICKELARLSNNGLGNRSATSPHKNIYRAVFCIRQVKLRTLTWL